MKNQVQLITYVDRLGGGGLVELQALLCAPRAGLRPARPPWGSSKVAEPHLLERGPLNGLFGGVHLLPFFHTIDGADAGFDPIDHTQVDARLGTWADVAALAGQVDVMGDVIVNHMSVASPQFQDWSARGAASPWAGLFLTFDTVFPRGASEADLLALYRPRPGLPFTATTLANGQRKLLWTTFAAQQADIDVQHPSGLAYLAGILQTFAANGVHMVRLDAVGYAIKRAGSSGFMTADTFAFIAEFAARAKALGIEVLVEVHAYYRRQIEIAAQVDWVYDFALPPLLLHAVFFKTAAPLKQWARMRPRNALNVLDTHDGIGIIDIGADAQDRAAHPGLVPAQELDALVERIHANSGGQSRHATGAAASNLDLYQVNCTYFDALGRDEQAYLAARAVQFFLPGVPQVYYVGLLAGGNDMALLQRSGVGRDINRHHYSGAEITQALGQPVVQQLLGLIRLRNTHPAFAGCFTLLDTPAHELGLRWEHVDSWIELRVDFAAMSWAVRSDTAVAA